MSSSLTGFQFKYPLVPDLVLRVLLKKVPRNTGTFILTISLLFDFLFAADFLSRRKRWEQPQTQTCTTPPPPAAVNSCSTGNTDVKSLSATGGNERRQQPHAGRDTTSCHRPSIKVSATRARRRNHGDQQTAARQPSLLTHRFLPPPPPSTSSLLISPVLSRGQRS